jgi:hypothetical protein
VKATAIWSTTSVSRQTCCRWPGDCTHPWVFEKRNQLRGVRHHEKDLQNLFTKLVVEFCGVRLVCVGEDLI